MSKTNKVVLTVALCGNGTTKAMTPYVPEQPDELVADIIECAKAGAAMPVVPLLLPTRGNHSPRETLAVADLDGWPKAIAAVARALFALNLPDAP